MDILKGIRQFIDETIENYGKVTWSSIEKKVTQLTEVLSKLRGRDDHKLASELLSEVIEYLEEEDFGFSSTYFPATEEYNELREGLLQLWYHLLHGVYSCGFSEPTFYKAIILIINRPEFGVQRLNFDESCRPLCKREDLHFASRYRVLLYHTQIFVMTKLNLLVRKQETDRTNLPDQFHLFAAEVCAITYFRLPGIAQRILAAISLTPKERVDLYSKLSDTDVLKESVYDPIQKKDVLFPSSLAVPATLSKAEELTTNSAAKQNPKSPNPEEEPSATNGALKYLPDEKPAVVKDTVLETGEESTEVVEGTLNPDSEKVHSEEERGEQGEQDELEKQKKREGQEEQKEPNEDDQVGSKPEVDQVVIDPDTKTTSSTEPSLDSAKTASGTESSPDSNKKTSTAEYSLDSTHSAIPRENDLTKEASQLPARMPRFLDTVHKKRLLLSLMHKYPDLFLWNQFHACVLSSYKVDSEDENLRRCHSDWLLKFKEKNHTLFLPFVCAWAKRVTVIISRNASQDPKGKRFQWSMLVGYHHLIEAVMYQFLTTYRSGLAHTLPKSFHECSAAILKSNPRLLNVYMKAVFENTNVYDAIAVFDALGRLEVWLKVLKALPADFDVEFFVRALEIITETDHHQLVVKVLSVLYNHSHAFSGEARKVVYVDFLMRRHFFQFFLHWESTVRNTFQQLLAFKALHIKRSQLHKQGFHIEELATSGGNFGLIEDSPAAIDAILYAKIESYIRLLKDQVRQPDTKTPLYPKHLEVYAPKALTEYKAYMSMYHHWEQTEGPAPCLMSIYTVKDAEAARSRAKMR